MRLSILVTLLLSSFITSCVAESAKEITPSAVRFDPAAYANGDFYAIPWPSELRMRNGVVDLTKLPARERHFILHTYLPAVEGRLRGFSPNGAVLFFLDTTLDTQSLPARGADTMKTESAVQLVNIEPGSPRFGERIPLEVRYAPFGGSFQPDRTLTLLPVGGFPLAPDTRYAAILLDSIRTPEGRLPRAPLVTALLDNPKQLPEAGFAPLVDALAKIKIPKSRIAAATVFRTADPGAHIRRAREVVLAQVQAPVPLTWTTEVKDSNGATRTYACPLTFESAPGRLVQGRIKLPVFLNGQAPYDKFGTGVFVESGTGAPRIQSEDEIPFTLSIPTASPPPGGFPIVIYMHGAAGSRFSFVKDGTACSMAKRGMATLAIDFPLHGDRRPSPLVDEQFRLINPENIPGALDIENQAAIDLFTLTRLAKTLSISAGELGAGEPAYAFNHDRIGYIGHSQGSFVGVPFLAYENDIHAAILSGSGGHMITFITDRIAGQSIDLQIILKVDDGKSVQDGIAVLLGIPGETPDRFHFLFTILQMILDPVDPINYAPYLLRETQNPKHIYQSAGFLDSYDPPGVNETLAAALGLDIAAPEELKFPKLELRGGTTLVPPIEGNKTANGKKYTAVNSQFPSGDHWVYLETGIARTQGSDFMASALTGTATVPARCAWSGPNLACP